MRKRNHSRQAARRRQRVARKETLNSYYRRPLRYEPLEDRRLLALVTVNTLSDVTNFNDNLTTLREAIFATNLVGGADTIDFAPALTANGPATILLTQGEIKITDSLTINGPGANLLTIDASGSDPTSNLNNGDGSRVFNLDDGNLGNLILVSLRSLTLTGGDTNSGGGAILSREQLSIEQTVIRDNATIGLGGGILARFGNVSLLGSTISGNVATSHGGGIYHRGDFQNQFATLTITDSTISGNTAGGNGGGVFTFHSDSSVTASTVSGNSAVEGGGLFENGRSLHLEDTTVNGNHSSGVGGGIRKTGEGSLLIGFSTIGNNTAGGNGGGVSLGNGSEGTISNSEVRGNTANGRGGGIASEGELSLVETWVTGNFATNSGGGIAILMGNAQLRSVQIDANFAQEGGGLDIRGVGTNVTVVASTIEGNKASNSGGGIHNRATVSVSDSTVRSNSATVAGGGLAALAANTTVFASTVSENIAPVGAGIAGVASANVFTITNSTISSNFAANHAAGIFSSGRLTLKHSTVTGNLAARSVAGVGVYGPTEIGHTIVAGNTLVDGRSNDLRGNATLAFSLLGVDTGATITNNGGNLVGTAAAPIDPKLGPLADNGGPTQTHALLAGSPAINAGDLNAKVGVNGVPLYDQRNNSNTAARIFNGRIDLGAFEYQAASDLNLVVDTLVDESDGNYSLGDLSLREAVELASKWSSIDTIRFDPALTASGPATILLSRGQLQVIGSTTIVGPGMNLLTIDGSGNDPTPNVDDGRGRSVFAITGRVQNDNVVMSGLTVTGADANSTGGGISAVVGSVTLNQMRLTGNAAGDGGGVAMSQGALILNDSTVANNSTRGIRGGGGGIYVSNGQLTIARSTISGNTAINLGGGIYFSDLSSSTTNQLLIHHSTISDNSADRGGGGILASVNVGAIAIEDNVIEGNRVTSGRGGGLYISARNATPTTISRNTIRDNSASFGGGTHFQMFAVELLIDESTISGNSATSGKGSGGGISIGGESARATIRSSTISDNTATAISGSGGGVAASGVTLKVESSTITGNSANVQGGGISSYSSLEVVDSEVSNNRVLASNSRGGGIALLGGSLLNISDSTISGNSSAGSGGGINVIDKTAQVTIMRSQITNNSAAIDGGGIQRSGGTNVTLYVVDSAISGNTAGRDGGGINVNVPGSNAAKLSGTMIAGNTAGRLGGGIAKHGTGSLNLWQSTVSSNTAVANGGGIMADDGKPWLDSSSVSGNSAGAQGGGLWIAKAADVRYSTIAQNSAASAGGGIFASSGPLTLAHTIVASNTAPAGRDVTGLAGTVISPSYSLIGSNAGSGLTPAPVGLPDAEGNLIGGDTAATIIAPLLGPLADNGGFTLPDGGHILTHALLPGSPAINAGDLNFKAGVDGVPEFDERGTPFGRVVNGRIDIGAFEYQAASDLNLLVDTLVDESDGDYTRGDLSLREAIELANMWPSVDTIHFDRAITTGGPATILLTKGELKVTDSITINGPGADLLTIDASGNDPTPNVDNGDGSRVLLLGDESAKFLNIAVAGLAITGGDVAGHGGGIFSDYHVAATFTNLNIHHNSAGLNGGGLCADNDDLTRPVVIQLVASVIQNNRAGEVGGGIYLHTGGISKTTIDQISVLSNSANAGGGIYVGAGGYPGNAEIQIANSEFADNHSLQYGGGAAVDANFDGRILISTSKFVGNVSDRNGAGLAVNVSNNGSLFRLSDSHVEGNRAQMNGGGAFLACSGIATLEVSDSVFTANTAQADGGGVYVVHQGNSRIPSPISTTLNRLVVNGNSAKGHGGGIAFAGRDGSGVFELKASNISVNSADSGGGIYVANHIRSLDFARSSDRLLISENLINHNFASHDGGGVYGTTSVDLIGNLTSLTLMQNTITDNTSLQGGGVFLNDASRGSLQQQTIAFNTIAGNKSSGAGGGVLLAQGVLDLSHTIVANNIAPLGSDFTGLLGAVLRAKRCLVGNNANSGLSAAPVGSPDANGNLIGTPTLLISPGLGSLANYGGPLPTLALLSYSPAINAGDPKAIAGVSGVPLYDQRGVPFARVYGGRIDIGAVEYQPNPQPGDYNLDGAVDSADYVMWRNTFRSASDLRADGNEDGEVDKLDYAFWRANFGNTFTTTSTVVSSETVASEPAFIETVTRLAPARRPALIVSRPSDFRPSVVDHVLATVAASRIAPAPRAAITEAVILDAGRENVAPTRRDSLGIVDEAFAAFKKLGDGSNL